MAILLLVLLVLPLFSAALSADENAKTECLKLSVCKSISNDHQVCHKLYNCQENEESQVLSRSQRSIKGGLLFGRPFRKPKQSLKRAECRKCEEKRSKCTTVSTHDKIIILSRFGGKNNMHINAR